MKYVMLSLISVIICIAIGWSVAAIIECRHRFAAWQRIVIISAVSIFLISVSGLMYFGMYHHADDSVLHYLQSSNTVIVSKSENGYTFDGPGEDQAIVFYPGGKVEETAYAPLMYKMADQGIDCFLLKLPLNMAIFDINAAEAVIEGNEYSKWYVMGHSLGGTIAAAYASSHYGTADGVILLSAYPNKELNRKDRLLSIYGSNDGCLERDVYEKSKDYWPEDSSEVVIEGGNHSGFGNYGEQRGDGEAAITSGEQQDLTAQIIISWITGKETDI